MITEKASFLGKYGQYVFEVKNTANKIEIAKAIEKVYGVKPLKVNIMEVRGKNVRYGKTMGKTKRRKKAIVTLPKEAKIEIYEGV
ncbi:50S ribosomal protein L23 [Candidatus Falkowbacteria bacterium RIFOXYB2_FULL_38_15]|uniref:Large ribosomal subunit protein uL23 n=1 Tax=Candidatus Falkowbacteria bacterium RIFOXYA2_FULL_38_12 TaxID=1797993 RepID=A0A1F5S2Y1_9BACT|nr:MAG: 50S ribosomal protein L23 [Candidatus Falkowbacteria bacterium RIFOXYA2_FULL_38_12]OGF33156.1 MAG: 50S ribosomal protein L23 [Candidatus Falkowbacteria bacterium RIFOXYB2_FULL_38_15]OGF43850.1 MAG: 50S ribosomal protein L23 [Candidatus Falkowbacteria bacterium RIFOXYD2_FULL_39_16]